MPCGPGAARCGTGRPPVFAPGWSAGLLAKAVPPKKVSGPPAVSSAAASAPPGPPALHYHFNASTLPSPCHSQCVLHSAACSACGVPQQFQLNSSAAPVSPITTSTALALHQCSAKSRRTDAIPNYTPSPVPAQYRTSAAPTPHQCSASAYRCSSGQYTCRTRAVPVKCQCGTSTVRVQHLCSTTAVRVQRQCSTCVVLE